MSITPNILYLHLDSTNQTYETSSKYSTYLIIPNNRLYAPNAYNIKFKLKTPIVNMKKIYLKSFETAVMFDNIRSTSLLNTITLTCTATLKTITIPDGTYTSLSTLASVLTSLAATQYPSDGLTFSVSSTTNSGNLQVYSSVHTNVVVEKTNLSTILGFKKGTDTLATNYCYGAYKANLAHDVFFHIFIPAIGNSNAETNNNISSTFKVLLSAQSNVINFSSENLAFAQFVNISNPTTPISELQVIIYDHLGYSLNSMNAEISLSLALSNV